MRAAEARKTEHSTNSQRGANGSAAPLTPIMRCMSDVQVRPVDWLWKDRIPLGAITLIAGEGGLGKSLITEDLAACVTADRAYPCGGHGPQGQVLLISCEDDEETTIVPRLIAAGARREDVQTFTDYFNAEGERVPFDLDTGMEALEAATRQMPFLRLLIIDPASAFCGRKDSHTASDVRALLRPLAEMAARRNFAVVIVTHFNKGGSADAATRVMGSGAWVHASRVSFAVLKDETDPDRRLFLAIKNNLGPDRTGFAYRVETRHVDQAGETPVVVWEAEAVNLTAQEAISERVGGAMAECLDFVRDYLADGKAHRSSEFDEACKRAGFSIATVKRARKRLKVRSDRSSGIWWVTLPEAEDTL